jgi:deoxyribonucleoside regulator
VRPANRDDLLVQVASLYYEQELNQQEIAERLQISRSNISRLLHEAKERGIVEIRVHKPLYRSSALEGQLVARFGLKHALVLEHVGGTGDEAGELLPAVGRLAARFILEKLRPGDVLAISWGRGVHAAATAVPSHPELRVDVVQMIGSVGASDARIDGPDLARHLAEMLGGRHYFLHAPVLVDNPAVRDMLLAEPSIQDTLDRARHASFALVGIGALDPEVNSFLRAGHLSERQLSGLQAQGAVGETCGVHFDIDGNLGSLLVNRRVIGLEIEALQRIPFVLAVACGRAKARPILGAIRGAHINALATDDTTARAVLDEADRLASDSGAQLRARPALPETQNTSI